MIDKDKQPASQDDSRKVVPDDTRKVAPDEKKATPGQPETSRSAGPQKKAPASGKGSGAGRTLARIFVMLIVLGGLAAAAWFGWQWLRGEKAAYDAARAEEISRLEARLDRLAETQVEQDELETLLEGQAGAQAALADRLNRLAGEMDALREAAQGGRRDLLQAEIEYLLRIAADELQLTGDVGTAIQALQAADSRLRQLADPRFIPVRQIIADQLRALDAVDVADVNGMTLKLGSLMHEVSEWPLRQAEHARAASDNGTTTPADAGWWARLRAGVDRLFSKLVVVQQAEPPPPLLKPDEHFFLYRNVELQLAAARAALLTGNAAVYRQSLEMAREWLNRFFDTNDPAVASAIDDINGLLDVALQPALPDIAPALERFRALANRPAQSSERTSGARTE